MKFGSRFGSKFGVRPSGSGNRDTFDLVMKTLGTSGARLSFDEAAGPGAERAEVSKRMRADGGAQVTKSSLDDGAAVEEEPPESQHRGPA